MQTLTQAPKSFTLIEDFDGEDIVASPEEWLSALEEVDTSSLTTDELELLLLLAE